MERLTFLNGDDAWCVDNDNCFEEQSEHYCGPAIDRLAHYENTGLEPDEIVKMGMAWEDSKRYSGRLELKLKRYEDMEEQGRLFIKPFKEGETAYYADEDAGRVLMGYVASYEILSDGAVYVEFTNVESDIKWVSVELPISEARKTVFLTREEAENALKGGAECERT